MRTELVQRSGVSHVRPESQQNGHPIVAFSYRDTEGRSSDVRMIFTGEFDKDGNAEYHADFPLGEPQESETIDLLDSRCKVMMMIVIQD